jgi:hypothetical protein
VTVAAPAGRVIVVIFVAAVAMPAPAAPSIAGSAAMAIEESCVGIL